MEAIKNINFAIAVVFIICYSYQLFFIPIVLFGYHLRRRLPLRLRRKTHLKRWQIINKSELLPEAISQEEYSEDAGTGESKAKTKDMTVRPQTNHYAVLISARNEEMVLAGLLDSLKKQTYPAEKISVFVVADNCGDKTADLARMAGASVWERYNKMEIGKGFALRFLLEKIDLALSLDRFAGFFVFDADNVLAENYISKMDETFCRGYPIVTGYRNSKNFADNWISAGYALWFLRESRYLNHARSLLSTSCAVSGTGFMFSRQVIRECGGWQFFLLTEDIEFTVYNVLHGRKIGFCPDAVLYDEQPVTFRQSWRQRMRWAKGYLQVFGKYGGKLVKGIIRRQDFSCFDMTMAIMPAIILTSLSILSGVAACIYGMITGADTSIALISLAEGILNAYLLLWGLGALTVVSEWKYIHAKAYHKLLYTLTFPVFMLSYIPISFSALFVKVGWKPIHHGRMMTLGEIRRSL